MVEAPRNVVVTVIYRGIYKSMLIGRKLTQIFSSIVPRPNIYGRGSRKLKPSCKNLIQIKLIQNTF